MWWNTGRGDNIGELLGAQSSWPRLSSLCSVLRQDLACSELQNMLAATCEDSLMFPIHQ